MINDIKVSIVVPAYNVEKYISECLDTLVNQTLEEIEIIVVNDASTDSTKDIICEYIEKYPNKIIFIDETKNAGLGMTRNKGIDIARGKYIAFVDSDDWVDLDTYRIVYEEAEKGYDIIVFDYISTVFPDFQNYTINSNYYNDSNANLSTELENTLIKGSFIACNKLFIRSLFENKAFRFLPIYYEDLALTKTIISFSKSVKHIALPLYYYRNTQGSMSKNLVKRFDAFKAYRYLIDNSNPKYRDEIIYSIIKHHLFFIVNLNPMFEHMSARFLETLKPLPKKVLYKYGLIKNPLYQRLLKSSPIPEMLHIMDIGYKNASKTYYENRLKEIDCDIPVKIWTEDNFDFSDVDIVREAYEKGNYEFVNDYAKLDILYRYGGICIDNFLHVGFSFSKLLYLDSSTGLGSVETEKVHTHIIISKPYTRIPIDMIATYRFNFYKNQFLPLSDRLVDYIFAVSKQRIINGPQRIAALDLRILPPTELLVQMDIALNCSFVDKEYVNYIEYENAAINELLGYRYKWNDLNKRVQAAQARVRSIESAFFWRVTKPFRRLADILKKIFKRT